MKKILFCLVIAILIAGTIFAQPIKEQRNPPAPKANSEQLRETPQPKSNRVREDNSITVEGALKLEKGFVAVENKDTVYIVPMLNRYIGFINGLKEGANVSIEGYKFNNMIRPSKVTIEGKSYDFPTWNNGQFPRFGKPNFMSDNNRLNPKDHTKGHPNGPPPRPQFNKDDKNYKNHQYRR